MLSPPRVKTRDFEIVVDMDTRCQTRRVERLLTDDTDEVSTRSTGDLFERSISGLQETRGENGRTG